MWCFGTRSDFLTLCERKAAPRDTVLERLLAECDLSAAGGPVEEAPLDHGPALRLMGRSEACVPRASETIAAKKESSTAATRGTRGKRGKSKAGPKARAAARKKRASRK